MLKIFIGSFFLFSAVSFYDVLLQKKTSGVTVAKLSNTFKRKIASQVSVRQNRGYEGRNPRLRKDNINQPAPKKTINFKQWSQSINATTGIDLQKHRKSLKKLRPSELLKELNKAQALPKPKRMQSLRLTAKRFIPESLLFYLAGNLVSITDHGLGISKINNPRFFQTEIDSVLSVEGGSHFFSFIFFNQMYSSWSQKKVQSKTTSVALSKFLQSAKNSFAGMAVAGLGASIVSDLGPMIYYCNLGQLKKVQDTQASDIFTTPAKHIASCDDLYLRFISGRMQSEWINQLALGLIPAAVLSHGVSASGKRLFKQAGTVKKWFQSSSLFQAGSAAKKAQAGKLALLAGKVASGTRAVFSATWVGALINFSLFVGIDRLLTSHVSYWGSKKLSVAFLNTYTKNLQAYLQKGLFTYASIKSLEKNNKNTQVSQELISQCTTKECIQQQYINQPKVFSEKDFLQNFKLYASTIRDYRQLLLSKGQEHYQNWITSFKKLSLKYDAGFQFYYDFINKIANNDPMIQSKWIPLVFILPEKTKEGNFINPPDFTSEPRAENLFLNSGQKQNLVEAQVFLNKKIKKINQVGWFFDKKILLFQLKQLKRQLFSKHIDTQLIGFKNLQTLVKYYNKKWTCDNRRVEDLQCSVVYLYKQLGRPQSKTYLEKYIQYWGMAFKHSYGSDLLSQTFSTNLAEDFLQSMVCGKTEGEISDIVGWDKTFYPPKIINLKNNSCNFNVLKTPVAHMLCDKPMGKDAINIGGVHKKKWKKPSKHFLTEDFQCANLWGISPGKQPKYSVMSTYFAVKDKGQVSTYNSLAELVVARLDKKLLICQSQDCRHQLSQAVAKDEDSSVFELWWSAHVSPYVLEQMNIAKKATNKILNQEILPVLHGKTLQSDNTAKASVVQLLQINTEAFSIEKSLKIESLVYQNIAKNIYKKYCKDKVCLKELNQWSIDVRRSLNILLNYGSNVDTQSAQKLSKNLKIAYHNFFYTLSPQKNSKVNFYFADTQNYFKVTAFEKKVLKQIFQSLNAQLFEINSFRSLLLERE
ncbi:MAG: hypothetical protein HAW63_01165 [Bdellovibrionaceae bacterium]|nr:hypothetical protein [Pseudobdellovibrionaceae bacterium]